MMISNCTDGHAVIFEHHQVGAVRELRLLRARQLHLDDVVADRRAAS